MAGYGSQHEFVAPKIASEYLNLVSFKCDEIIVIKNTVGFNS